MGFVIYFIILAVLKSRYLKIARINSHILWTEFSQTADIECFGMLSVFHHTKNDIIEQIIQGNYIIPKSISNSDEGSD